METISPYDDQNPRYWITIISFLILVSLATFVVYIKGGEIPKTVSPFEFVLLSLACFRLIRLFTYDQIMRAVRDLFVEKTKVIDEKGQIFIVRKKVTHGGRRSLSDLFSCPWCIGMWVSYFMVFFYFIFPPIHYFVVILALAGVASSIQIFMNMISARAELYKKENNILN